MLVLKVCMCSEHVRKVSTGSAYGLKRTTVESFSLYPFRVQQRYILSDGFWFSSLFRRLHCLSGLLASRPESENIRAHGRNKVSQSKLPNLDERAMLGAYMRHLRSLL